MVKFLVSLGFSFAATKPSSTAPETSPAPLVLPSSQLCTFESKVDPCYALVDLASVALGIESVVFTANSQPLVISDQ